MPFLLMQNPLWHDISGAVRKNEMFILPADLSDPMGTERLEWELLYFI